MKFEIANNVILSYKRLSYEPWYAFAEFVDNSTQAYFHHKSDLDPIFKKTGEKLKIEILYDRHADYIKITDNSIGMNEPELDKALKVGTPPDNPDGRSKYGLGMKTAACWFGNLWTLETKKLNAGKAYKVTIDVNAIGHAEGETNLIPEVIDSTLEQHYTILTISNLNRKLIGRTLTKIKEYLGSIYRFDLQAGIEILWNGELLVWHGFDDELYTSPEGFKYKKEFEFEINHKPVSGWVGVLGRGFGSRKKAGFSIIQNKRVIQGWPTAFKPSSIFGEQEDGSNDLVNQRVVGELTLDKFSVSHTKDKIVWEDEEEDQLDTKLGQVCADARELARTLRFHADPVENPLPIIKEGALNLFTAELKSAQLSDYLTTVQPFPEKIIESSFKNTSDSARGEDEPDLKVDIGSGNDTIHVKVYFNEKSEFEPYVLTEMTIEDNKVVIIINMLHPHIKEMTQEETLLNFFRHCVYDGVAEWKAIKLRGSIQPYTVKFLKDGLLRVPYQILAQDDLPPAI